jgi:hypothetical protein
MYVERIIMYNMCMCPSVSEKVSICIRNPLSFSGLCPQYTITRPFCQAPATKIHIRTPNHSEATHKHSLYKHSKSLRAPLIVFHSPVEKPVEIVENFIINNY